jgi:hypothetical protein
MALQIQNVRLSVDWLYNALKPQFSIDYYYAHTTPALDTNIYGLLASRLSKFRSFQGCRVTRDHMHPNI